jgi:hypothetical protein
MAHRCITAGRSFQRAPALVPCWPDARQTEHCLIIGSANAKMIPMNHSNPQSFKVR